MKTTWVAVASSSIDAVSIDGDNLLIRFKNKSVYSYKDVPLQVILDLMSAESKGKFFNKEVKGKYEYVKLVNKA